MFTKKSEISLPPLPVPPNNDQMIEDLNSARSNCNDPVFLEGKCKNMLDERTSLDMKFETVQDFIRANERLNVLIKETEIKLSMLQGSRDELLKITEDMKDQAIKALN